MTMTELDQELERLRGSVLFDDEPVRALYRAALARAEAAEAEAEDAILVASDAAQREENAMHALSHFRARVAELEAQLAAQGWRPLPPAPQETE